MKTILITGARGFLGHHVVKALEPYKDLTILTPTRQDVDLLRREEITYYLMTQRPKPDAVIHLAAQCGGIGVNREKPGEFLYNNLMMTTNLIEACRRDVPGIKFVGVGTVCSYPKHASVPFKEDEMYNGYPEETNAPYGLAKRMQLDMLRAYRSQYNFNGIFLMPVNLAGEHDNFDDGSSHVIPSMMKKFHRAKLDCDKTVTIWGDGSASREFLYAGDCAEAIVRAMFLYNKPDPVNIGNGKEVTIRELAEKMRRVVGFTGKIIWDTSKPNGQMRRCLDVSRAENEFGFTAKTTLDELLQRSYKWAQEAGVL